MKYGKYLIGLVGLLIAISLPKFLGIYYLQMLNIVLIYAVFALSWDMLMRSGQLSFGIAGFAGIGGYVSVLCSYYFSINPIFSILAGSLFAALIAALVGMAVLRLRLLYFAIVTLAIGEIFRIVIRNLEFTGGAEGMILPNAIFKGDAASTYWLMLTIGVLTVIVSIFFQKSKMRFALTSIANDEIVAASSGVNILKYLVIIFAITSGIQGMSGAAYSQLYGSVTPEGQFSGSFTILPIVMALFGGLGTTWGPVLGAAILTIVAEALKLRIPYGYLLVYGVIMVVAILWFPGGIMGFLKKIHEKLSH